MLFNSIEFIVFFVFIFGLFWIIPHKTRWFLLLIASYFFYMCWEPAYILLILFSTSVDYFICNHLTSSNNLNKKKVGLWLTIVLNLGLLFFFKYYNFFQETTQQLLAAFQIDYHPNKLNLLLPVGISFYTFQTLSYSIDVYRNTISVERHFGKFALFVSFFPQLVAGPIERAKDLLPQLNKLNVNFDFEQFKSGSLLFIWGLFKKVVIADNLSMFVDTYYDAYQLQNGGTLLFASYLFALQIYCDFSGYSDMAIGLAKLLGIELKSNFNTPYLSNSITTFWRNWHISLSQWFRDYLYIPLGGNKNGKIATIKNTMITMIVAGFWHGANWTFIMWGAVNGFLLVLEKIIKAPFQFKSVFTKVLSVFLVFHLITFGWIFFRSQTMDQAFSILSKVAVLNWNDFYFIVADNRFSPGIIGSVVLVLIEVMTRFKPITQIRKWNPFLRYSIYLLLVISVLFLGSSSGAQFIYFQF